MRLKSPDPRQAPKILLNAMGHADDWPEMRACVRLTREIFAQKAFDPYRGREIQPGADVVDDAAIDEFIRRRIEIRLSPVLHLPDGRGGRSLWPWSIRTCAFAASRVCASSTLR